jgi:hypothetical protein
MTSMILTAAWVRIGAGGAVIREFLEPVVEVLRER